MTTQLDLTRNDTENGWVVGEMTKKTAKNAVVGGTDAAGTGTVADAPETAAAAQTPEPATADVQEPTAAADAPQAAAAGGAVESPTGERAGEPAARSGAESGSGSGRGSGAAGGSAGGSGAAWGKGAAGGSAGRPGVAGGSAGGPGAGQRGGRGWIEQWRPEEESFWAGSGRRVATRNLIFSIFAEHLAFSLWSIWSVVVVSLPAAGFHFNVGQLFWLVSMPNLLGSALRLPYTFAVPRFGGRNWTVISTLLLLIPSIMLIVAVTSHASYGFFLLAAATAGLGGGNFASSMANISFFYPESRKGSALGFNAAGGNIGVAVGQLLVPILINIGTGVHIAYAGMFYAPLVIIAAACALLFMDNLRTATSDFAAQAAAVRRRDTWVMSFLYIGTFGSFIGYSFALPLLIKTQFPHVHGSYYAWMGALVGSLARPFGGWLSDRVGGARVTLWNFVAMGVAAGLVVAGERSDSFPMFFGFFLVLFVTSGIGNGSTYRMIPAIFARRAAQQAAGGADREEEMRRARREAAATIGIASSIGAFGGFGVTRAFATSIGHTKVADAAFYTFIAFYAVCFVVTWWFYLRRVPAAVSAEPAELRELARV